MKTIERTKSKTSVFDLNLQLIQNV